MWQKVQQQSPGAEAVAEAVAEAEADVVAEAVAGVQQQSPVAGAAGQQ